MQARIYLICRHSEDVTYIIAHSQDEALDMFKSLSKYKNIGKEYKDGHIALAKNSKDNVSYYCHRVCTAMENLQEVAPPNSKIIALDIMNNLQSLLYIHCKGKQWKKVKYDVHEIWRIFVQIMGLGAEVN